MPPGGIRTRNSRVVADSQHVSGLGRASKPQPVSGPGPASKSQPVSGPGPASKPQPMSGPGPTSKPQPISVVGNQSAIAKQLNQSNRHASGPHPVPGSHHAVSHTMAVPAGPSHGPQSVVGNQTAAARQFNQSNRHASGPHPVPGSRPAVSHTVAVPTGPSHGPQAVVGNQTAAARQINQSNRHASGPHPVPGSHHAVSHTMAVPAGPSHGPQSVVGNQTAAARQFNQSNRHASDPHPVPGSQHAVSHTVAVPTGPSHGPQSMVGNQTAAVRQMNESNMGSTGEPQQRKNVRKKAQNKTLKNFIESGGGKPKIEIPIGKLRPLGKWAKEWTTELGIIVRQNIPLTLHYWKQLTDEFKTTLYNKVLLRFDVDMSLEHVRDAVDDSLKDRFKDRRHKLHLYYLSLADGVHKIEHPEKTITQQEWESLCAHFETEEFKRRSARNKENRKVNRVNHRGGSKSFVRHRFDQRDPETGEEPDRVEFYRNMRWNDKKGWIAPEAEENYEKMLEIRSQPVEEGGKELSDGEIVEKVLGKRSGYVIGLGRAEVPPSRKARVIYNMDEVNQLRMRTEEQDRELNELRAWKASQEELSNSQQQKIDAQQQKIDAQAKKQEETDLILIALKQKLGL